MNPSLARSPFGCTQADDATAEKDPSRRENGIGGDLSLTGVVTFEYTKADDTTTQTSCPNET
jgi:hypothetical protein